MEYFAFGETFVEEHRSSNNSPYKFNGKELDEETGWYYYGARYYDPRISVWLSVDPLASYDPMQNSEHYIDGQHNGGVFNPMNLNVYGYTYQNPLRYIDPNGKQVDVVLKSSKEIKELTNNGTTKAKWDNVPQMKNSLQVNAHGNPNLMWNFDKNGKRLSDINGPITFNKRFENNKEWQTGKTKKGFNLVLYSCRVGNGKKSLAARLSDYYENITVIAPSQYLWGTDSKFTGVYGKDADGNKDKSNPGYWFLYQDGKVVGAYDATWEPGTSTKGHEVDLSTIPESHYNGEFGEKDLSKNLKDKDGK
ncbi:MAG: RHS repeat-associated core domain-containing protein [Moheibacter sp.]